MAKQRLQTSTSSSLFVSTLCIALLLFLAPPSHATRQLAQAPTNTTLCCARLASIGFNSSIPTVIIDSSGQPIPHKIDTNVNLCTCNNGAAFKDYEGLTEAAGRGTSSANFTKKSYKLDLKDPDGIKASFPFLGMPSDSNWILYGPELDKTLGMRNYLTYNLARASGRYASRTVYCEVFLVDDGKPLNMEHYNGVYIALEKMEIGKNRVNITKQDVKNPQDLSGGYLFLYDNDNIEAGDVTFGPLPGWEHPFLIKDPNDATREQLNWLLNYLDQFQTALNSNNNSSSSNNWTTAYKTFWNVAANIDFFLLVELSKSPDGYRGSTYLYKDQGPTAPITMGPAWDYNEAYGECCGYPIEGYQNGGSISGIDSSSYISGGSAISPEGYRFNICENQERCVVDRTDGTSVWYRRMWQDPSFKVQVGERWRELRAGGVWSDENIKGLIGGAKSEIEEAALRNYGKYMEVLMVPEYSNASDQFNGEVRKLLDWVLKRVAWLDGALDAAGAANGGGVAPQATVTAASGSG